MYLAAEGLNSPGTEDARDMHGVACGSWLVPSKLA